MRYLRDINSLVSKRLVIFAAIAALVAQPFGVLPSSSAFAADGNSGPITTEQQLIAAAADSSIRTLSIKANIEVSSKINFSGRNVHIDGNGNTLTFTGDAGGWQGNYILQAYRNVMTVKNLNFAGGDAALIANGATLNLQGNVRLSGGEFGGIEVSNSGARLNVGSANLTNESEANAKPTAWVDKASTSDAAVYGPFTETTHIGNDQKQYYLNGINANIVAVNSRNGETFATIQNAVNDSDTIARDTIVLNKDVVLDTASVRITKAVTIDGNGKTVKTLFNRGAGGVSNAVFVVLASDVTIKNVTVEGNGTGSTASHGIVVNKNHTNVVLENIVARNNAAAVIVNAAGVTINGIHTENNNWYGINVDNDGAVLTIEGAVTHDEGARTHIFVDDRTENVVVNDPGKLYARYVDGNSYRYILDEGKPSVDISVDSINPASLKVTASDDQQLKRLDVSIWKNNNTEQVAVWGEWIEEDEFAKEYNERLAGLADGTYTVRATVSDLAGKSTDALNVEFTFDSQLEQPNITYSNNGMLTKDDVTATITANEPITIDDDRWEVVAGSGGRSWQRVFSSNETGSVEVKDLALNSKGVEYVVSGIDKNAPVLDRNSITVTRNSNGTYTIRGVANEPLKGVQVSINNGQYLPGAVNGAVWSFMTGVLPDGVYTVDVEATDGVWIGRVVEYKFTAFTQPLPRQADPMTVPTSLNNNSSATRSVVYVPNVNMGTTPSDDEGSILGTNTKTTNTDKDTPIAEPSEEGWKLLGLAWYWWVVIVAALAGAAWYGTKWYRGRQEA